MDPCHWSFEVIIDVHRDRVLGIYAILGLLRQFAEYSVFGQILGQY